MDNVNKKIEFINDYECLDCELFFSGKGLAAEVVACPVCFTLTAPYYTEVAPTKEPTQ